MTSSSPPNICHYSSLIGFYYQHGIGCKVESKTFFNVVKNNQKVGSNQIDEAITFYDNDIKKLNEIILQYFYSIFLY